jgi:CHAT domain-containing protein
MKPCGDMTSLELGAALAEKPDEAMLCQWADQLKGAVVKDAALVIDHASVLYQYESSTPRSMVRALTARAHARAYRNEFEGAKGDLDLATRIAEQGSLRDELAGVQLAMVQPLARQGLLQEARVAAERAVMLSREAGLGMIAAKAEVNLGVVLMMLGEPGAAIASYDRAIGAFDADPIARAMIGSNRAEALLELDRFDEASVAFAQATASFRAAGHLHGAAIAEGNQADLLSRMGRVDEAVAHFESARRELGRLKAAGDAARLLAEQAEALFTSGSARASLPLFEESVPKLLEAGLKRERTRALLGLGLAGLRLGHFERARSALAEAIVEAESVGASNVKAEAQLAMGELELGLGKAEESLGLLEAAAQGLGERPVRLATVRAVQAAAHLQMSDGRRAMQAVEAGLAGLSDVDAGVLRARLGLMRGLCLRAMGDVAGARDALLQAVEQAERFRGSIAAEQLRTSYLESATRLYIEATRGVLDAAEARDALPEASAVVFEISERLRQRTLLDQMTAAGGGNMQGQAGQTERGHRAGWLDEVSREEAAYLQQLNAMYAQLGPAGRGVLAAKNLQSVERLRKLEQAAAACRIAAEASGSRRRPIGEPMGLEAFSQRLPERVAVVSYVLDGEDLSAQVIRREGCLLVRRVAPMQRVAGMVRRLEMALSRAMRLRDADGAARSIAQQLRQACLEPVEAELAGVEELVIVPAGPLHAAPLVAAGVFDAECRRIESMAPGCTLAAGAPMCQMFAQGADEPSVLLAGMSDAVAPRMEEEVTAVMKWWPKAVTLRGAEASGEAVLAKLPMADIVHLACHAVFDPEFPGSSRLLLADRWVTSRELVGRLKPGAVVILAGCNTGRSGETDGEDRSGFIRSLLAGGASAVLTALWPLHDESALKLFDSWHRMLSEAQSDSSCISGCTASLMLAKNLRRIQLEAMQRGEPFYQWGGLALTKGL